MKNNITTSLINTLKKNGRTVLIKGEWGIGKSYYVANELNPALEKQGLKLINISLFGIETIEQLKKEMLTKIIINFKAITGIVDKVSELVFGRSINLSDLNLLDIMFSRMKKKPIFCFDDLERLGSLSNLKDFLGFFNNLSETKGISILVICNPKELMQNANFKHYNEKVFNKIIIFDKEINDIKEIILTGYSQEIKGLIEKYLIPLYHRNPDLNKNIRILKKCVDNIKEFVEYPLWATIKRNDNDFYTCIQYLVILTIETDLYGFPEQYTGANFSIYKIKKELRNGRLSNDEEQALKFDDNFTKRYGLSFDNVCLAKSIVNFIKNGYFDEEQLKNNFENTPWNILEAKIKELWPNEDYVRNLKEELLNYVPQASNYREVLLILTKIDTMQEILEEEFDQKLKNLFLDKLEKLAVLEGIEKLEKQISYMFDYPENYLLSLQPELDQLIKKTKEKQFIQFIQQIPTHIENKTSYGSLENEQISCLISYLQKNNLALADEIWLLRKIIAGINSYPPINIDQASKTEWSNTLMVYLTNKLDNTTDKVIKNYYKSWISNILNP